MSGFHTVEKKAFKLSCRCSSRNDEKGTKKEEKVTLIVFFFYKNKAENLKKKEEKDTVPMAVVLFATTGKETQLKNKHKKKAPVLVPPAVNGQSETEGDKQINQHGAYIQTHSQTLKKKKREDKADKKPQFRFTRIDICLRCMRAAHTEMQTCR